MTKKMMLLALAAIIAALLAMPGVASANWGIIPINQSFSGNSQEGFVGNLTATGEPKITCEGPSHVSGAWTNGTQGSLKFDFTNCHVSIVGITSPCKTAGAPLSNTIVASGGIINVTIAADATGVKRGVTATLNPTTVECAGISTIKVTGSIIGRITNGPSPCPGAEGAVDSNFMLEFLVSGGAQTPMVTDASPSVKDDLTAQTGSEAPRTAALEDKYGLSTVSNTTWTCNAP